jgi:hypothetical protein
MNEICRAGHKTVNFVWLIDCLSKHEQLFLYLAAVAITGDRAAN